MGKLFGTDGVRGVANSELTPELALELGRAYASILKRNGHRPKVVVGKDTRLSSDMLEAAYNAGLMSGGVDVIEAGILPTPGVAYLVKRLGADGGTMISASHNPIGDNGIKIFGPDGFKLDDAQSEQIEQGVARSKELDRPTGVGVGRCEANSTAALLSLYLDHLASLAPVDLVGIQVVLDCAYGAAYQVAPAVFGRLRAEVDLLHGEPDGEYINVKCGSTDLGRLRQRVLEVGATLGLAFDGDADRCLAVDEKGDLVDGDRMLLLFADWLKGQGRLAEETVVATVMSNFGLEQALTQRQIHLIRAAVGDRYVLEAMRSSRAVLGGEQSGHLIFLEHSTTGDGVLCALMLASVVASSAQPLSTLAHKMSPLPQKLVNVRTSQKEQVFSDQEIAAAIARQETRLASRGRLLIRPSGTEPLVRVMAEGPDESELDEILAELCGLIQQRLG